MKKWRWDQGRLDYFQFDEIKNIANALVSLNGRPIPRVNEPDTLRFILSQFSERPFAPENYRVWRNYKRVFGCQLLATEIDNQLICTDLCKEIAIEKITSDEYFLVLAQRFYYSSPVFDDYQTNDVQIFPFCAIVKFLVSRYIYKNQHFVSIDDVVNYVKGNNVIGTESISHYSQLSATGTHIANGNVELRQIREMVIFISQISFLKWKNPYLFLDVKSKEDAEFVAHIFNPTFSLRNVNPALEILNLGKKINHYETIAKFDSREMNPFDIEFSEGNKTRISHIRTERSSKLREFYFQHTSNPNHCDMCEMDTQKRYPWTDRVLELHHLLPLSSPIRFEKNSSSLKDIVGLCPSCHRATHKYYSKWFKYNDLNDFRSYQEAKNVYNEVKHKVVI
ncbi:MAG: hypothetical protein QM533_05740 [Cytophagales bacterium]|nr:hypothetical protein [Cytophagales bacterium]